MELSEVVSNPHYAFPVVGVLLCALLVFAFGFKSPAQPPSFDFDDGRKQSSVGAKKRKSAKKSLQNGHFPETSKHNNEKTTKLPNEKQSASPKSKLRANQAVYESSDNKTQIKTIKKNETNALRNKDDNIIEKRSQGKAKKEDQTGEWVQQLSRKEKKSRKREENPSGLENDGNEDVSNINLLQQKKVSSSTSAAAAADSRGNSPSKKNKKLTVGEAHSTTINQKILDDKDPLVTSEEQKRKSKVGKETSGVNKKSEAQHIDNLQKNISKPSEEISEPATVVHDVESSSDVKLSKKKSKNKVNSEANPSSVSEKKTLTPHEASVADKSKGKIPEPVPNLPLSSSTVSQPTSPIVFDELADAWEEPKGQKKKKKARKDQ